MIDLNTPLDVSRWLQQRQVRELHGDSRQVQAGDAFVAWPGAAQDGRRYVAGALQAGAVAALVERDGVAAFAFDDARIASVAGLKEHAGEIAHQFYGGPSEALRVVAITGTNGKTSSAWWSAQLLAALGTPSAVVGTLGLGVPGQPFDVTGLTTPDPIRLHAGLRRFADQGLQAAVIEASSIGLEEGRMNAVRIHTAVFTNFTQDHLDYHGSMAAYWQAKRALFDWPGLQVAVVNVDDPHGAALAQELQQQADAGALDLWTLSAQGKPARLQALNVAATSTGLRFDVQETAADGSVRPALALSVPLVGDYNVYNLLSALAVARAEGRGLADAVAACRALTPVPGRMQAAWHEAPADRPLVLVDYAHTPDALEKALRALQPLAQTRGGQLWCVVGCGGDRDAGKRPLMAAVAEREAQHLLLTSDNPRTEDPQHILQQMLAGVCQPVRVQVEPDRAAAIARAVQQADGKDVILLAGKGHEDYQDMAGVKRPFSDVAEARRALEAKGVNA
ncbi:MAG TPA: UDP-N-acetylmuramoyl-L-alanyl-D-glutamate--2,6-diaminopimelate ligase [Macromonas sp.]|nr:UDP-N-acetylmuramoyl-L-alanyl-D-glutamate--2,6-diaminopimelate ligase [Macromonas sp.]